MQAIRAGPDGYSATADPAPAAMTPTQWRQEPQRWLYA
mgnify:FL=1